MAFSFERYSGELEVKVELLALVVLVKYVTQILLNYKIKDIQHGKI